MHNNIYQLYPTLSPNLKTILQIHLHFHQQPARTAWSLVPHIFFCLQLTTLQQPLKQHTHTRYQHKHDVNETHSDIHCAHAFSS